MDGRGRDKKPGITANSVGEFLCSVLRGESLPQEEHEISRKRISSGSSKTSREKQRDF